jgi:hypothetical protein
MKSFGKLLGNFTIKNEDDRHLFKIFFYENSLSFEESFLNGINKNDKINKEFEKINKNWSSGKHSKEDIIESLLSLIGKNEKYISEYFYKDEELDENGHLIENNIEVIDDNKNKYSIYFDYIKQNKELEKIKRKDFESKIVDKNIGEYYVENFEVAKNKAEFYKYKTDAGEDSYIMVIDNKIKIGFVDK